MLLSYYHSRKKPYPCDGEGFFTPVFKQQWLQAIENTPKFQHAILKTQAEYDNSFFFKAWSKHWPIWTQNEKVAHMHFLVSELINTRVDSDYLFMFIWERSKNIQPYFDLMSTSDLDLFTREILSKPVLGMCAKAGTSEHIAFSWYLHILNYLYSRDAEVADRAAEAILMNGDLHNKMFHTDIEFNLEVNSTICTFIESALSGGRFSNELLRVWTLNAAQYGTDWLLLYFSKTAVNTHQPLIDKEFSIFMGPTIRDLTAKYNTLTLNEQEKVINFIHEWFESLSIKPLELSSDLSHSFFDAFSILPEYTPREKKYFGMILNGGSLAFNQLLDLYILGLRSKGFSDCENLHSVVQTKLQRKELFNTNTKGLEHDYRRKKCILKLVRSASLLPPAFSSLIDQAMSYLVCEDSSLMLENPDVHSMVYDAMPEKFERWSYAQVNRVFSAFDTADQNSKKLTVDYALLGRLTESPQIITVLAGSQDLKERFFIWLTQCYLGSKMASFDPCPDALNTLWLILDVIRPLEPAGTRWFEQHSKTIEQNPTMEYRAVALETIAPGFGADGLNALKLLTDEGNDTQWDKVVTYVREEFVHFLRLCSARCLKPDHYDDILELPQL